MPEARGSDREEQPHDASLLSAALSNFYHLALSDVFASLVKVGLFARMIH